HIDSKRPPTGVPAVCGPPPGRATAAEDHPNVDDRPLTALTLRLTFASPIFCVNVPWRRRMHWYTDVILKKYADFEGRARRKEYWMFFVFNLIASAVLYAIVFAIYASTKSFVAFALPVIYSLAIIVPSLALIVRRLHDQAKSGA